MKSRRREINVFSMSALDLFASALGAFILISIVLMPYFLRIEPEEVAQLRRSLEQANALVRTTQQQRADAMARLEDARARLLDGESALAEAEKRATEAEQELKAVKIPDLDIVICLDVTGSMRREISGLKREIRDVARVLNALAPSAGIGVVAFGDRENDRPVHHQDIRTAIDDVARFVDTLHVGMGGGSNPDPAEAVVMALERARDLSWRSIAQRRFIVVVTDAPSYAERRNDAMAIASGFARNDGHYVATVLVNTNNPGAGRFLEDLASSGGGEFVNATQGQSMLSSLLIAVVR